MDRDITSANDVVGEVELAIWCASQGVEKEVWLALAKPAGSASAAMRGTIGIRFVTHDFGEAGAIEGDEVLRPFPNHHRIVPIKALCSSPRLPPPNLAHLVPFSGVVRPSFDANVREIRPVLAAPRQYKSVTRAVQYCWLGVSHAARTRQAWFGAG